VFLGFTTVELQLRWAVTGSVATYLNAASTATAAGTIHHMVSKRHGSTMLGASAITTVDMSPAPAARSKAHTNTWDLEEVTRGTAAAMSRDASRCRGIAISALFLSGRIALLYWTFSPSNLLYLEVLLCA
jgi:hypothetical protein